MPIRGRVLAPEAEAARRVPTKGPTQAKDASEKVSPMSRLPRKPPLSADWVRGVRVEGGMVIAKAPSRVRPKAMKRREMKGLTQGLEPRVTMPKGPRMAVVARPSPEKRTMMPRQKTRACTMLSRRPPDWRLGEEGILIGIMGENAGGKVEPRPQPEVTAGEGAWPQGGGAGRGRWVWSGVAALGRA